MLYFSFQFTICITVCTNVKLFQVFPSWNTTTSGLVHIRAFHFNCCSVVHHNRESVCSPPIGIIQLAPGCDAANDFLSLPPYYKFVGRVTLPDSFNELLKLHNKTNSHVWTPFHEDLPNFTKLDLPADLPAVLLLLLCCSF